MFAWSKDELAVRDAVRSFVDKEVRPLQDELEHGGLPPYDLIRLFFSTFGLDTLAAESFDRSLARAEALESGQEPPPSASTPGEGLDPGDGGDPQIELVKVSMGIPPRGQGAAAALTLLAGFVGSGSPSGSAQVPQKVR